MIKPSSQNFHKKHTFALLLHCEENYTLQILFTFSEEAFRPGWDRFQDFLVYGLIILGNHLEHSLKHYQYYNIGQ